MPGRYWIETLGCPKNRVDSDKLEGRLAADGYAPAASAADADLVVVNTCAFVDDARRESVDTILALADRRADGARLVVTGCLAERYGDEVRDALPEVDLVAGFGVPVTLGSKPGAGREADAPSFDLLNLPRPRSSAPWAYVKVAEGCDRDCGFCAIPTFRGPQRSRTVESVLEEVDALDVREVVLVAQDLARYGMDRSTPAAARTRAIVPLVRAVAAWVARVRLLYLYPSDLTDELVDTICDTGVPYFDLSLQHVSPPLLRRMRRWGDGQRFLDRIDGIRRREPDAAFRSNFLVGYPGETEDDHDALLSFLEAAQLDWCGFFAWSPEDGTYATTLTDAVPEAALVTERLRELSEVQDRVTAERRAALVGREVEVLVDEAGIGRTHREAPEIDGVVAVAPSIPVGTFATVRVVGVAGPDLEAEGAATDLVVAESMDGAA